MTSLDLIGQIMLGICALIVLPIVFIVDIVCIINTFLTKMYKSIKNNIN